MTAPAPDWLGAARAATREIEAILGRSTTTEQRARETGTRGQGGDRTLEIDAAAEAAVFAQLDALAGAGQRFTVFSEERGRVDFDGDPARPVLVVVDPLDGSRNAKRGLSHHALSIAVAEGRTMGDVVFGYVFDFGPGEEWTARRGGGAALNGTPLDPGVPEQRRRGRLELLGVESADPALGPRRRRRAGRDRPPAASPRRDRHLALPGRRRPARRHGHPRSAPARWTSPRAS